MRSRSKMQRHMLGRGISSSWKGRTSFERGVRGPCNGDGGLRSPPSRSCVFPPRGPSARRRTLGRRRQGQHGSKVPARTDHAGGGPAATASPAKTGGPKAKRLKRIGIVDTSFSRYDMASAAIDELRKQGEGFTVERYTVPGIKDLAAGARILFDRGCDLVLALGMVGRQPVDKDCALAADFGLQAVQAQIGKHILGVMVHEEEATDEAELAGLFDRRTREHAANAYDLLFRPAAIRARAGTGQREGFADAGPLQVTRT